MTVQLREWQTSSNVWIPYFNLDMTETQLLNTITTSSTQGYTDIFQGFEWLLNLVSEQYLARFRWMVTRAAQGWNPANVLGAAVAGNFRYLTDLGPEGPISNHSPGTGAWVPGVTWERYRFTGASYPGYVGLAADGTRMRPLPSFAFPALGATGSPILRFFGLTTDFKIYRFTLTSAINAFGWQGIRVDRNSGNSNQYFPDPERMISRLVEEFDEEEETMARFNPRSATDTVGIYLLQAHSVHSVMNDIWDTSIIDSINAAFIGDGSNSLIGVQWFYGGEQMEFDSSPDVWNVIMGNVKVSDTGVARANSEMALFDFGSISVPQYYGDYRDWTLTEYQIYLPFIGIVDLPARDVVGKSLYLKYWINLSDGSAVCNLSTTPTTPNSQGLIFTGSCSWGYDIPVRVDPILNTVSRIAKFTTLGMFAGEEGSYSSGEMAPNSNVMGDFEAKLIIHRKSDLSGSEFEDISGEPGAASVNVGSASGYLRLSQVYNSSVLPVRHADEIVSLLTEGVYI